MFSLSEMDKAERKNINPNKMKCSTSSRKIDSDIPKSMQYRMPHNYSSAHKHMSLDLILLHLTLEEGEADVSLRCRDGAVAGHRLVLAALSPMLCRAFRELGGDEEKVCIQLPDFTTEQVNLSTKFHMSTKFCIQLFNWYWDTC